MTGGPPTQSMASGPETLADGRYRLHRRLGAGGMGIVVQATDARLDREVAVKLLADNLAADEVARERFLREARAAAMVSDPHVVQVHDVDEEAGRPYFVMELVDGPSLEDVLARGGPLPPEEVADVAADALAGLARAHATGLLHRDLKPGNLLRRPDGLIKITDFGVAQATNASELTRTGMVVGTGPYLAPERAAGEVASVRTDLYALGATLHELLTGRRPTTDPGPEAFGQDVPPRLRRLLERLLAHDPRLRPASAEAALALLAGEVDTATQPAGIMAAPPAAADPTGDADGAATMTPSTDSPTGDDEASPRTTAVAWGTVVAIAVGLLLVALAFQALRGGDEADTPTGVERADEPAETARNLADWLQERTGD